MPNKPKIVRPWLLGVFVIVLIAGLSFIGWQYWSSQPTVITSPTVLRSPTDDLSAVEGELNKLDSNFEQLDKIDSSEDEAPSL